jgi:hypothetical protein
MSTDEDWGLFEGTLTKLYQVWPPDVTDVMIGNKARTPTRGNNLVFVTRGEKETLELIAKLHNQAIRGESNE